jgi:pimeloyl-ACP methyl ester carboxylesterase
MAAIYDSAEGEQRLREAYQGFLAYWPIPRQELRVKTREGETFVVASGDPAAPPLVLLHGSGSNATAWMGYVAALAERHRVYCVDMIGEPGLSAPSRPPLDSGAYADWLDDVLDGLGAPRAAFVGISLGGWLALDYATRRPGRVDKLALLCPGGIGRIRLSFMIGSMIHRRLGGGDVRRALASAGAGKIPAPYLDYLVLVFTHFRPRTSRQLPLFSDKTLAGLQMPILMIVGGKDTLIDSAASRRRLERAAPHAKVLWLPEASHFLSGQAEPIEAFLAEQRI